MRHQPLLSLLGQRNDLWQECCKCGAIRRFTKGGNPEPWQKDGVKLPACPANNKGESEVNG